MLIMRTHVQRQRKPGNQEEKQCGLQRSGRRQPEWKNHGGLPREKNPERSDTEKPLWHGLQKL
jgi:hypothetical protein